MSLARGVLTHSLGGLYLYIYIYSKLSDFIWYQIIINYIYTRILTIIPRKSTQTGVLGKFSDT